MECGQVSPFDVYVHDRIERALHTFRTRRTHPENPNEFRFVEKLADSAARDILEYLANCEED